MFNFVYRHLSSLYLALFHWKTFFSMYICIVDIAKWEEEGKKMKISEATMLMALGYS